MPKTHRARLLTPRARRTLAATVAIWAGVLVWLVVIPALLP